MGILTTGRSPMTAATNRKKKKTVHRDSVRGARLKFTRPDPPMRQRQPRSPDRTLHWKGLGPSKLELTISLFEQSTDIHHFKASLAHTTNTRYPTMISTPTKHTQHTSTNNANPHAQGNSTPPGLKEAVYASRMRDFEHAQANEKYQYAMQKYAEKEEKISELEAQKIQAQQNRDAKIEAARTLARNTIREAKQEYEVESNDIDRKILRAKKNRDDLGFQWKNGVDEARRTRYLAKDARINLLIHNGGTQAAADMMISPRDLTSPMQGLGIVPADQPPTFAVPHTAPAAAAAAAAATGGGGGGGGVNIRRSTRLPTSRYASSLEAEHQPGQIDSESEYSFKSDDESLSSGWSESSGDIKYDGRDRRSKKKAPAKSAKKKTPAKTPESSKRKRIKDMTPEEKREYRREINKRGQANYRKRIKKELAMHRASPAVRMHANADNYREAATRICDHLGDARKDLFYLTEGLNAAIE